MSTERMKLEQGRAAQAYKFAEDAKKCLENPCQLEGLGHDYFKAINYSSYSTKLPTLIQCNGLGAALAFIKSKGTKEKTENNQSLLPGHKQNPKNAYNLLYEQIFYWIKEKKPYLISESTSRQGDFVEIVINLQSSEYRALTIEVMALLNWMKRFSVALLGEGENN